MAFTELDRDLENDLRALLIERLLSEEFQGKKGSSFIQKVRCPECGKREGYTSVERPFVIICNRKNSCANGADGITYKTYAPDIKDMIWEIQRNRRQGISDRLVKPLNARKTMKTLPISEQDEAKTLPIEVGQYQKLQAALAGSLGQKYLEYRGIPFEVVQEYGLGFASDGLWPHVKHGKPVMQWRWGRVIFPHTDNAGRIVNLYGRAIGSDDKVPRDIKHAHLPGKKGVFNARALLGSFVFICEGPFDALSLIAAGFKNSCAIFGVHGLRWDTVQAERVVFCLDQDAAGGNWKELAWNGLLLGKDVFWLPPEVYRGCKDLNECWMKYRKLDITLPSAMKKLTSDPSVRM